jgi:ABC-type cobalt transport system substrate-binding protein
MKDTKMKIYFIIILISLSCVTINSTAEFTIFPEEADKAIGSAAEAYKSIFETFGSSEKIIAAVQFASADESASYAGSDDKRNNLNWKRVLNVKFFF